MTPLFWFLLIAQKKQIPFNPPLLPVSGTQVVARTDEFEKDSPTQQFYPQPRSQWLCVFWTIFDVGWSLNIRKIHKKSFLPSHWQISYSLPGISQDFYDKTLFCSWPHLWNDLRDVWKPAQDGSGHYPAAEHVLVIAVVLQGSKNVIENTSQVGKVWNV